MLSKGAAKKVTIYVNEDTQRHLNSLYESILTFLMHKGVAGRDGNSRPGWIRRAWRASYAESRGAR